MNNIGRNKKENIKIKYLNINIYDCMSARKEIISELFII